MALDVGCFNDAIVCAKFTFRSRVKQGHVLKRTTSHQYSCISGHRATLWLNRIDLETEGIRTRILKLQLRLLPLLLFSEGQDRHIILVYLTDLALFPRYFTTTLLLPFRGVLLVEDDVALAFGLVDLPHYLSKVLISIHIAGFRAGDHRTQCQHREKQHALFQSSETLLRFYQHIGKLLN